MQLIRPYGVVIDGNLELGLELSIFEGVIQEVRPHTGIPEPYVVSPAFVNAHSHLEYRGLQGKLTADDYWQWIREITLAKRQQQIDHVQADANLAAEENRRTGVALIGEHSDRPVSGVAMKRSGLRGVIFQEVITRFEEHGPDARMSAAVASAIKQGLQAKCRAYLAAHAYQTVDEGTLRWFGSSGQPFSMHVAETDLENQLTLGGTGAIADTFRDLGVNYTPTGERLLPTLKTLGLVRTGAQFVHCCALNSEDLELLASSGVSVAHCPRSNVRLGCPVAPIRELLDGGVKVGLGLDSAASSGPIDMFDEMRSCFRVSTESGRPVFPEEIWRMATEMGADSLRFAIPGAWSWKIEPGSAVPLVKIHLDQALSTEDLIEKGGPGLIEWL